VEVDGEESWDREEVGAKEISQRNVGGWASCERSTQINKVGPRESPPPNIWKPCNVLNVLHQLSIRLNF
jgi:hypothetical protein